MEYDEHVEHVHKFTEFTMFSVSFQNMTLFKYPFLKNKYPYKIKRVCLTCVSVYFNKQPNFTCVSSWMSSTSR